MAEKIFVSKHCNVNWLVDLRHTKNDADIWCDEYVRIYRYNIGIRASFILFLRNNYGVFLNTRTAVRIYIYNVMCAVIQQRCKG